MLQIIQYQKTGEITVEDLPDLKLVSVYWFSGNMTNCVFK